MLGQCGLEHVWQLTFAYYASSPGIILCPSPEQNIRQMHQNVRIEGHIFDIMHFTFIHEGNNSLTTLFASQSS